MRRLGTLAAAITLLTAAPASAAEITVTGTADPGACISDSSCTGIRSALTVAARLSGPDTILVREGIHQLQANGGGQLVINTDVTIRGAGARLTSVVATANARVFEVENVTATIAQLTMSGGDPGINLGGGNLHNLGGVVTLDHVRVTDGAAGEGAGIANENGTMTVQSSLVDGNLIDGSEGAGGAGILNIGDSAQAALTLRDSTIAGNTANGESGGGIMSQAGAFPTTTTLDRVTVARNSSTATGGLVFAGVGSFTIRGSIVDDNTTVPGGGESNCASPVSSGGGNVVGTAQCAVAAAGDIQNASAMLSAGLVNAGGQTDVLTVASGSPAIDRVGSCTGADQRDLLRPQGGSCDSGAYEVDQAPDTTLIATPPTFSFSSTEPGVAFQCRVDRPSGPGTFFACTSPLNLASLRQGSYTLVVRAVDSGGSADPSPAMASFVAPPRATAGRFVLVDEVRGRVRVKVPGGKYVNLNRLSEIPDGSLVDTRNGTVRLSFQPRAGAKVQTAKFWDGIFKVDQRKKIMELVLVEKLAKCAQQGSASAAARKKKSRRLWGDGKGRFRTKGTYSSATVRGTKWLTQDSCAGTLTKVRKGKVDVRDFVRKRTIRVKKGQQYLARPG